MRRILALALLLGACQPSSQLLVHIDTDAPVVNTEDPAAPFLFDRLRIEIERGDSALEVSEFDVSHAAFAEGRVSFGVAPPLDDSGLKLRARLFLSGHTIANRPPPNASLDTTIALPSIGSSGIRELSMFLSTEDVGRAIGRPDPIAPSDGVMPSKVGTWTGATRIDCTEPAMDDEVCVQGGAFWMGDPRMNMSSDSGTAVGPVTTERLVVVSPFFIDRTEISVGTFRKLGGGIAPRPAAFAPAPPFSSKFWCTFTDSPSGRETLPLNCIDWRTADNYCRVQGKQLPTEAQLEFVASARGGERAFVWGNDEPTCDDAVWGRGGGAPPYTYFPADCLVPGSYGGPRPIGGSLRDRVRIGDGEVVDLAGNLAEYVRDRFQRPDEDYWSRPGIFRDPLCEKRGEDSMWEHAVRGGAWSDIPYALRAAYRTATPANVTSPNIGFRCVRSATD